MGPDATETSSEDAPRPSLRGDRPRDRSYRNRFLLGVQAVDALPTGLRLRMLRWAGAHVDPAAFLEAGVTIVAGPLSLGARCYVNRGCLIDARGGVSVGERTLIGPRVTLLTATHPVMPEYPRAGPASFAPVTIGDDVWIGASATVLPGATIGRGCVVAAGALVRGALEPDTLYAGVPARKVRSLPAST